MYFLIISGMSGAGKSRAVATLEDLGYYCVDNLPIALIPRFAEVCLAATERYERVALVTDVRAGGDFQQLFDSLDSIRDMGCDYRILFLDTDTATLIRRYKETRRKHPLMDKGVSMTAAIEKERTMLSALRNRADFVVDTTGLSAPVCASVCSPCSPPRPAQPSRSSCSPSASNTAFRPRATSCSMYASCPIRITR